MACIFVRKMEYKIFIKGSWGILHKVHDLGKVRVLHNNKVVCALGNELVGTFGFFQICGRALSKWLTSGPDHYKTFIQQAAALLLSPYSLPIIWGAVRQLLFYLLRKPMRPKVIPGNKTSEWHFALQQARFFFPFWPFSPFSPQQAPKEVFHRYRI